MGYSIHIPTKPCRQPSRLRVMVKPLLLSDILNHTVLTFQHVKDPKKAPMEMWGQRGRRR